MVQVPQVVPFFPQLVIVSPALQIPDRRQPAHVHTPETHVSPVAHAEHEPPFFPHCVAEVPALQTPLSMQPAQVTQAPLSHVLVPVQAAQAAPPDPQLALLFPFRQVMPSQQPLPQFPALQEFGGGAQTLLWQVLPPAQVVQAIPPVPQAESLDPPRQVVPSQQPVGQLVASQTQDPLTQRWPLPQAAHVAAFLPQRLLRFPGLHTPLCRQPGQVAH